MTIYLTAAPERMERMRIVHVSQLGTEWTVAYKRDGEDGWLGDSAFDELDDAIARAKSLTHPVVSVFKSSRQDFGENKW